MRNKIEQEKEFFKEVEVHDSGVKFAGIKRERESWSEQWVRKIILTTEYVGAC